MTTSPHCRGLHAGFLDSAARFPERPALEIGGECLAYAQLRDRALGIAAAISAHTGTDRPRVGILASRSVPTYSGILGTLMAGGTVVPLNPAFPAERTAQMLALADVAAIVVDAAGETALADLLPRLSAPMLVVAPAPSVPALVERWPSHRFIAQPATGGAFRPLSVDDEDLAYLFFTSGSTGVPKGVGVLHRNTLRFVAMSMERYAPLGLGPQDRFSQFYDITFDSSMFDLFVCWAFGACLCCPTTVEWVNPNKFIVARSLSVIDIVPSMGHNMNRSDGWRAGRFPGLRLCRFGGEALAADLAAALAAAAPQAVVDNVYGPTECTVDAAYYRWDRERSPAECRHGVVPIGCAGPQVGLLVVGPDLNEVPMGAEGELLISGPQVTPGYWKNPERTAQSFVRLQEGGAIHYRTGDLVRRVPDGEPIPYLGRMDYQIKVAGVRIELGEVEQAMRQAAGTDMAVAVGWPQTTSGASGIVGFVVRPGADGAAIRRAMKQTLPAVMVPREIHVIDAMPLNVNGKIDRKALLERLAAISEP